jgi:hypothetical protein
MPEYSESLRCRAFGVYSGCPCSITLKNGIDSTDRNLPRATFNKSVDDLISQWHSACDKYQAGPTVGARITENWNRNVRRPYGLSSKITCVYNESAPGGGSYCKFSLKEEIKI